MPDIRSGVIGGSEAGGAAHFASTKCTKAYGYRPIETKKKEAKKLPPTNSYEIVDQVRPDSIQEYNSLLYPNLFRWILALHSYCIEFN